MSNSVSHNTSGSPGNSGDAVKETANDRFEVNDKAAAAGVAAAGKTGQQKAAARTFVTLDVKPWDDTTDMSELEASVRKIEHDGLVWGTSKMIAVGFGVQKLQINLVVEDEKVSVTDLQEEVEELEEYVQSSDVVTMQKL